EVPRVDVAVPHVAVPAAFEWVDDEVQPPARDWIAIDPPWTAWRLPEQSLACEVLALPLSQFCGRGKTFSPPAVVPAIRWLIDHQSIDGSWDPVAYPADGARRGRHGTYTSAEGRNDSAPASRRLEATAFALAALAATGHARAWYGDGCTAVRNGLRYLRNAIDADGAATPIDVHAHAAVTLALVSHLGLLGDRILLAPAQRCVNQLCAARCHDAEGPTAWGRVPRAAAIDADTSGWAVLALQAAWQAGLRVPADLPDGLMRAARSVSWRDSESRENEIAVALLTMQLLGVPDDDPQLRGVVRALSTPAALEDIAGFCNVEWVQAAAVAAWFMCRRGRSDLRTTLDGLFAHSLARQWMSASDPQQGRHGSWDATGDDASRGRIVCTAIHVLTLSLPDRFGHGMPTRFCDPPYAWLRDAVGGVVLDE
ncbi:MAG: hypothetical protein AB7S36_22575, partial [Planctomycetota bacterium]